MMIAQSLDKSLPTGQLNRLVIIQWILIHPMYSFIHWKNHYPLDGSIGSVSSNIQWLWDIVSNRRNISNRKCFDI